MHPVRVAIRRMRATLSTFGGVYRRVDRDFLAQEAKWAGLLLGDVRDLQVLAERFADESAEPGGGRAHRRRHRPPTVGSVEGSDRRDSSGARGVALFAQLERWREDPPFSGKAERPADRAFAPIEKADRRVRSRLERARAAAGCRDEARAATCCTMPESGQAPPLRGRARAERSSVRTPSR